MGRLSTNWLLGEAEKLIYEESGLELEFGNDRDCFVLLIDFACSELSNLNRVTRLPCIKNWVTPQMGRLIESY